MGTPLSCSNYPVLSFFSSSSHSCPSPNPLRSACKAGQQTGAHTRALLKETVQNLLIQGNLVKRRLRRSRNDGKQQTGSREMDEETQMDNQHSIGGHSWGRSQFAGLSAECGHDDDATRDRHQRSKPFASIQFCTWWNNLYAHLVCYASVKESWRCRDLERIDTSLGHHRTNFRNPGSSGRQWVDRHLCEWGSCRKCVHVGSQRSRHWRIYNVHAYLVYHAGCELHQFDEHVDKRSLEFDGNPIRNWEFISNQQWL